MDNGVSIFNCSYYSFESMFGEDLPIAAIVYFKALAIDIATGNFAERNDLSDTSAQSFNISMYAKMNL